MGITLALNFTMMENPSRSGKAIPLIRAPQIVPSRVCLSCEVCCRFPERDSSFRPFFSESEIQQAIASGMGERHFSDHAGCQVEPVPNPFGEGYLCPAFDPETSHCRIYDVRPLDCQIYPFVLMWNDDREAVNLGWDRKCPFMIDQSFAAEKNQSTHPIISHSYALPESLHLFAQTMSEKVESPDFIKILSANPQLVMTFQEDVVVIQKLPRLTQVLLFNRK